MGCPEPPPLSNVEYFRRFNRRAAERRVPLTGSIELTHRCNLRCMHCYLRPRPGRAETKTRELSTEQLLGILDQATAAGCLNLLITGGEPVLRPDFGAIYRHAKQNGLLVTVFTNGTLITEETVRLFADLPPHGVEITVYGATAATYERITGVRGSFGRCMAGIQRLLAGGFHLALKTVLMTLNRHEFSALQDMAEDMGVRFRFDAALFPRFDGDKTPTRFRVDPRDAVAIEMSDESRLEEWRGFFARQGVMPPAEALYQCSAGVTGFHIDPFGNLSPCLMVPEPSCSLLDQSFEAGWRSVIPRLHDRVPSAGFACSTCDKRALCGYCPAFFELENGSEEERSDYLCALGHCRYDAIVGEHSPVQLEGELDEHRGQAQRQAALREAYAASR